MKNDREKDQFLQENFLESVISIKRNDDGDLQFNMEYSLVLNNKSVKVCRKVFAEAYGLKECDFKRCSQAMKAKFSILDPGCERIPSKNDLRLYSTFHRQWKDDRIHDYNFAQTEK